MDAVEIIAHRGSSYLAPENTHAAIELAWQEGADAAEGDFRLTADGKIVSMHDDDLRRTAGINRRVADCTLAELQSFDVGAWKSLQYAGERVPTLDELLGTVPGGKRFYVEIKCGVEIIEPLRLVIARCSLDPRQIIPIGLQFDTIAAIKQAIPQCPAYWVVEFQRNSPNAWRPTPADVLCSAQAAGLDGLDLMATGPIDAEFARQIHSAGLGLCVWTVDDPKLARHLIGLGVQGITTNRPGWLRERLRG
ncbi:MAG: glycerophosphodiester phosphodiesterase [Pirellulales bacterium]|nr:glycerophosphodiester phosphodiesterase [Pirellulales bacterium]